MSPRDYLGLHARYERLLSANGWQARPSLRLEKDQERLSKKFEAMMQAMYRCKGSEMEISLLQDEAVKDFVEAHAGILNEAMRETSMSDLLRAQMERSNEIFSGFKAFHELHEAFPSILDEKGDLKPFETFLNDVRKIDETYNKNYLQAEYHFVVSSASMAARWEQIEADGDEFNVQYRTVGDSHVRPKHAAMNGITLPPSDPFWEMYYPPNGWNCRCTAVQVRKEKYATTPHGDAMALGEKALGNEKAMFSFNSGKQKKTFPDYNPYTIQACKNCDVAKG